MMGVEKTQTIQSELASSLLYSCSRSASLSLVRHRIQDKEVLLQSFYSSMFWIQLRIKRYFQFFVNHISKLSLPDFLLLAGSETKKWFSFSSIARERTKGIFLLNQSYFSLSWSAESPTKRWCLIPTFSQINPTLLASPRDQSSRFIIDLAERESNHESFVSLIITIQIGIRKRPLVEFFFSDFHQMFEGENVLRKKAKWEVLWKLGPSPSSLPSPSLLPPCTLWGHLPSAHIQARHHHCTAFNSVAFYKTEYFLFANAPLNETNLIQSRPYIWGICSDFVAT